MPILRHIYDSATGTYADVEVTQEVYDFYRRNAWAIRRNDRRFYDHEIQFSSLIGGEDDAFERFSEFISTTDNPLHILCSRDLTVTLRTALQCLSSDDQNLIHFLVVKGQSERWYAQKGGLAQKTVHNRKIRALKLLRLQMKDK